MGRVMSSRLANTTIGSAPTRVGSLESSIAEYLGATIDADFSGKQVVLLSDIGVASGVAGLDATSKIPVAQVPDLSGSYIAVSQKAAASGVASLDASSKVVQLPAAAKAAPNDVNQIWLTGASGLLPADAVSAYRVNIALSAAAYRSASSQSIAASTLTALSFEGTLWDAAHDYALNWDQLGSLTEFWNASSPTVMRAPYGGIYAINAELQVYPSVNELQFGIRINGSATVFATTVIQQTTNGFTISTQLHLAAGDNVEAVVFSPTGATVTFAKLAVTLLGAL